MKRRELLGLVGSGAIGVAGCLDGLGNSSGNGDGRAGGDGQSPTDSNGDTTSATAAETASPELRSPTETPSQTEAPTPTTSETATETTTRELPRRDRWAHTPNTTWTPTAAGTCPVTGVDDSADEPGEGWPPVDVDADESPYDEVEMDVTLLSQFADTCPAAFRISLTNVSDETIESGGGWSFPFSEYWSGDDETRPTVYAFPVNTIGAVDTTWPGKSEDDGFVPTEKSRGCWNADVVADYGPGRVTGIEPGETLSDVYKVFNRPDNDECLPAGSYRFESDPYLGRHNDGFDDPWGYTITIES